MTYKTVAVPASRAIAEIAKLTKTDLGVNEPLASQPIILRLYQVPLKDAMDKIAAVLNGEWSQNKTAFTLQRTATIQARLEEEAVQRRLAKLRKIWDNELKYRAQYPLDLESAVGYLQKQKRDQEEAQKAYEEARAHPQQAQKVTDKVPTDEEIEAMSKSWEAERDSEALREHVTAEGRLSDRVLMAIDPAIVASLNGPSHMVFSTAPKPLQYKLEMSDEDFQVLVTEQNIWTAADRQVNKTDPDSYFGRKKINPNDARLVVVMDRDEDGMSNYSQLYILDSKGRQLVEGHISPGMMSYQYGDYYQRQLDLEKLAEEPMEVWTSSSMAAMYTGRVPSGTKIDYATAPERSFQIKLRLANKITFVYFLSEYQTGMTAFGPVEKLPPYMQKKIAAARKERESMRNFMYPGQQAEDDDKSEGDAASKQEPPSTSQQR